MHHISIRVYTQLLSCVRLFATLWTVAHQGFPTWDFPGKNTGVGCHFFLQGIFPTQGSNLRLLQWQVDSLPLSHLGRLRILFFFNFRLPFLGTVSQRKILV